MEEDSTVPEAESGFGSRLPTHLEIEWVWPTAARSTTYLAEPRLVLGRDDGAAVRLASSSVSRRHAEIYRDGPIFALRDLRSRNGTFLNGKRVAHAALSPGDTLRVGDCVGVVALAGAKRGAPLSELAPDLWGGHDFELAVEPARSAAASALPLVLVGETGSGKERVARAVHHWSGRTGGFHALNCATLPEHLVEAELFGHAKGAFTGAERPSVGRFRAAHGGTLLLDEVVDLPLALQPKLLRLLEEGAVVPLGETRAHPVDVRIIATAQTPLEACVRAGTFRQDLRARLAGLVVELPPLRERKREIVPLLLRLLAVHTGGRPPAIEAKLAEAVCLHDWPDNVRELDLLVRRLLALHGCEAVLRRTFLPEGMRPQPTTVPESSALPWFPRRRQYDLHHLAVALRKNEGNVKAAAKSLGFSRQRAYRLMCGKTAHELMAMIGDARPEVDGEHARELAER